MTKPCFAVVACLTVISLSPAAGPEAAKRAHDKAAALFGADKLWTFHLTVTAKDWEAMQPIGGGRFGMPGGPRPAAAPPGQDKPPAAPAGPQARRRAFGFTFPYVKGALEFQGETYKDVGVRFKGNSSYMMSARGLKRPFKIDFNRYVADQTFHGLTMVNLANNLMDATQLRESLSYAVFRAAGVPAPRTAFVQLYLTVPGKHDREYLGLYTLIEQVNGTFLKDHFQTTKGMLLKPEGVRGLQYLGEQWSAYEGRYRPKKPPGKAAARRLIEFTKLVNNADDEAFRKQIGTFMDVDEFLRFLAANVVLVNLDSFIGLGHNYYLYLHPKTNKFVWIPWDLNLSFATFFMGGSPEQMMDLSIRKPCMGDNRLVDRVLAIKEYEQSYRNHLRALTTKGFRPETMHADIDAAEKLIRAAVEKEAKPQPKGPGPGFPVGRFPQPLSLKTFVTKRVESVTAQLDGKSKGQELRGRGFGPGGPGGPGGFGPGMFLADPALKEADADKDGKVSLAEFNAAVKRLFVACDKDKKGALDEKALAAGINGLLPAPPDFGGPRPRPNAFGPGTFLAGAIVKRADADKDGKISLEEMLAAAKQLFKEWDKDKNGVLDKKEITEGLNGLVPRPPGFGPPPPRPAGPPPRPAGPPPE